MTGVYPEKKNRHIKKTTRTNVKKKAFYSVFNQMGGRGRHGKDLFTVFVADVRNCNLLLTARASEIP